MSENTRRFIAAMNSVTDWKRFNREHPREDFGQYVKRLSEEAGNLEDADSPSDAAVEIAFEVAADYQVRSSGKEK